MLDRCTTTPVTRLPGGQIALGCAGGGPCKCGGQCGGQHGVGASFTEALPGILGLAIVGGGAGWFAGRLLAGKPKPVGWMVAGAAAPFVATLLGVNLHTDRK